SYGGAAADDFTAQVDWGDGTQTAATVAGASGSFTVTGSHVYARLGSFAPLVSITDDTPGTASATATSSVAVADAPLTPSGVSLSLTEGTAFSGTVATFNDGNLLSSAGDFTATIDWGDGTPSTTGNVALVVA